jgi:hypothetical protein
MLSRNLEQTLHRALSLASDRKHEYATLEHLLRDHLEGPEWSREEHFRESAELHLGLRGDAIDGYVRERLANDGHCHFHVWDGPAYLRFVLFTIEESRLPVEVVEFATYGHEALCVLRRPGAGLDNTRESVRA